jgi:hypothetical protein
MSPLNKSGVFMFNSSFFFKLLSVLFFIVFLGVEQLVVSPDLFVSPHGYWEREREPFSVLCDTFPVSWR